jgi:DNA-binding SARP family transcriptional activator/tetratricopeptide (TPR) repeat protein
VPDPASQIRFGLLGPVLACHQGTTVAVPAARQRTLLAALLLKPNQAVESDELIDRMWDGAAPAAAAATLRSCVLRLRRALGPVVGERVRTRSPGYSIEIREDAELDLRQFDVLRQRARDAAARLDWTGAAGDLRAALGLWRGAPLEDIPAGYLKDRELPSLQEGWIQTNERLARAELELGRPGEALERVLRLQIEYPYREQLSCLLMRAQVAAGRSAEALAEYARLRHTLVDELGVEPGMHSRLLQAAILAGRPMPGWPGESPSGESPSEESQPGSVLAELIAEPVILRPVPRQLPGAARHFVGRSAQLRALMDLVGAVESVGSSAEAAADPGSDPAAHPAAGQSTVIAAIGGMAGAGKTTLAVHWAQQMAGRFPDGQLYVNLRGFDPSRTPMSSAEAVRGFLDALGVEAARLPVSLQTQVALYRSLLADKRVLIVLDNARDDEHVRLLLPGGSNCLVIVTSRTRLTGLAATEGAHVLTVGPLTPAESRELLARHIGQARLAAEPSAVEELIARCAGLALATGIVAARAAANPHHSLAATAAQLRDARGRLDALETGDTATDLRTVFSWSYQHLSDRAARLFRLLGLHPGSDISSAAAASLAGLSPRDARAALAELARAHLLAEPAPGRYSLHDLLRAYAEELADTDETTADRHAAMQRVLDHYLHTLHHNAQRLRRPMVAINLALPVAGVTLEPSATAEEAFEWCDTNQPALMAALNWSAKAGFDVHACQIAWCISVFLDQCGRWPELAEAHQVALVSAKRLGDHRYDEARAHRILGYAHGRMGDYEYAGTHLQEAADIFQSIGYDVSCGHCHRGLAWVLGLRGEHDEAMEHAQIALNLMLASPDLSNRAAALNAAGRCHAHLGAYEQAIADCRQALALYQQADNMMGQAEVWYSLGLAYRRAGDHVRALTAHQDALDLFYRLGDRHYIGETLSGLADTHDSLGDQQAAIYLWRRALVILEDIQHPDADQVRDRLLRSDPVQCPASYSEIVEFMSE